MPRLPLMRSLKVDSIRIRTGGQTGVDRAALQLAVELGIPVLRMVSARRLGGRFDHSARDPRAISPARGDSLRRSPTAHGVERSRLQRDTHSLEGRI